MVKIPVYCDYFFTQLKHKIGKKYMGVISLGKNVLRFYYILYERYIFT